MDSGGESDERQLDILVDGGMMWWAIAMLVVSVAASYAMRPSTKGSSQNQSTLEDFDVPTAEDGKQMPVIFGTVTVQSSNIVWYGDLDYEAVKESSGGK